MAKWRSVAVIGGGAWGTALAHLAASSEIKTLLWARDASVADAINTTKQNPVFLAGAALDARLRATARLEDIADAEAIIFVVPAQFTRAVLTDLRAQAVNDVSLLLCTKGVERHSNLFMSEVAAAVWPQAQLAALSGPSFAADVAAGLPTAVTIACQNEALGQQWAETLKAPHFRPYLSTDLVGVEIGGAVKNVLAIAAGAVDGRRLGASARAALVARGFAEIQRLGAALGAKPETLAGLSGLGDLILTATSTQSRNYSLGRALGAGAEAGEVLQGRRNVSEGAATAAAIVARGAKAGVDLPICRAVADLVDGTRTIDEIVSDLLSRPLKPETT